MNVLDKKAVRALFSKTDRAVYISHLDLMRTMQRAMKRSGIPIWYSEGFNPRAYLNFPLALSLGIIGKCEPVDFYITEEISFDEIRDRLNSALPAGIRITDVYSPVNTNKDIFYAEYRITVRCEGADAAELLTEFFGRDELIVMKHSKKRGMISLDIKKFCEVRGISDSGENSAVLDIILPAGNEMNINAGAVTDSFAAFCSEKNTEAEILYTERTKILCDGFAQFV